MKPDWISILNPDVHVLYKAYPYHRADDVPSIIELAQLLPNAKFWPIPSTPSHRTQDEIQSVCNFQALADADPQTHQQFATWMDYITSSGQDDDFEVWVDQFYGLPSHGDVIIVGSCESYLGYNRRSHRQSSVEAGNKPVESGGTHDPETTRSELRKLLDSVDYPNRFVLPWGSKSNSDTGLPNATGTPPVHGVEMRDRKTGRILRYERPTSGNVKEDVGFISVGRTPEGRQIFVIAGSAELGTYAGVNLLIHEHPNVAEAFRRFASGDADRIDIGYECRKKTLLTAAADHRPHPFAHSADRIATTVLNATDLVNYRRNTDADALIEKIIGVAGSKGGPIREAKLDENLTLTFDNASNCIVISAGTVYLIGNATNFLFPSASTKDLFSGMIQDARKDADLHNKRNEILVGENLDNLRHTITRRHVLILGESGVGKQHTAEAIAGIVNGTKANIASTRMKDSESIFKALKEKGDGAPHLSTVTLTEIDDLEIFSSVLFGIKNKTATGVDGSPGYFLSAGRGVLFLDEFFEIEPRMQAKLLVALSTGKVRPLNVQQPVPYLCKIVAATNLAVDHKDLERKVRAKEIRRDIKQRFARIYAVSPLRHRIAEILPILLIQAVRSVQAENKLDSMTDKEWATCIRQARMAIRKDALETLLNFFFPGNIRELKYLVDSWPESLRKAIAAGTSKEDSAVGLNHLGLIGVEPATQEKATTGELPTVVKFRLDWMTPVKIDENPVEE